MPKITSRLDEWNSVRVRPAKTPPWKGPTQGVTQSMIANYLQCKERFRIKHIDGLSPKPELYIPIEFGHLWHLCEERLAEGVDWEDDLEDAYLKLRNQHKSPKDKAEIDKLYSACRVQFPIYVKYWKDNQEVLDRTPLIQEGQFDIKYILPSKRQVLLRGKWDAVDLIGDSDIYLQENKSKTSIQVKKIEHQLLYDLQSMTYLIAIETELARTGTLPGVPRNKIPKNYRVCGVRYNVVVRALSGGLGSIKQRVRKTKTKDPETLEEFYVRLGEAITKYQYMLFKRWKVEVSSKDLKRFKTETLHPILENMLDDYEWWEYAKIENESPYDYQLREDVFPNHISRHWRFPYGCYALIAEGGYSQLDDYINTGSTLNLINKTSFFSELV